MKLTEVISSNIKAVGYDAGTLVVMFNGGSIYEYTDVPPVLYEEFKKADSKGRFINQNVVKYFKYTKVDSSKYELEEKLVKDETK